jgi:hypothetical protein
VHSRGVLTAEIETPEPGTAVTLPISKPGVGWHQFDNSKKQKVSCAHCGASSMSASAVALVVFDLDACCWYPEMYQLWVRGQIANPGLRTHVHGSRYKGATPCHSVPLRVTRAAAHRFRKKRQHQTTRCTTPPVVACDCLPMWHCAGLTATNGRRGARSLSVWPAAAMSPHGGASVCRNSSSNLGLR